MADLWTIGVSGISAIVAWEACGWVIARLRALAKVKEVVETVPAFAFKRPTKKARQLAASFALSHEVDVVYAKTVNGFVQSIVIYRYISGSGWTKMTGAPGFLNLDRKLALDELEARIEGSKLKRWVSTDLHISSGTAAQVVTAYAAMGEEYDLSWLAD